ncbi:MAG: right-handed parallel beta-helix repeat-containing protein [Promethearchaeota archaeon]
MSYFSVNPKFLATFNNSSFKDDSIVQTEGQEQVPLTSDYTLVAPINISSPSDWAQYPFITGNGTDNNPYVIENIEIQGNGIKSREQSGMNMLNYSDVGIYIGAAGNFTIRNCRISSISLGIYLGLGTSVDYMHSIRGVEIDDCGIGIYVLGFGGGGFITVNISRCKISNCNWVSVKIPEDLESSLYGGFGLWVKGDQGSIIEYCKIQGCSIGLYAGPAVSIVNNQLINCGFLFAFAYMFIYYEISNNTINGKPLGLFMLEDDLTLSGSEASQYGQLIFVACHNLHLSNIQIKEPSSFGLMLLNCNHPLLDNILCENQQIGFYIYTMDMTADNLQAKNCVAGFSFIRIRNSNLAHISINDTEIPVCGYILTNTTIGIEKSTRIYLINYLDIPEIQLNSSISSSIVPRINMTEFDFEGFIIQLDEIDTYHITGLEPGTQNVVFDFIIVIFEPSEVVEIPGFPLIWFYTTILLVISILIFSIRYKKDNT